MINLTIFFGIFLLISLSWILIWNGFYQLGNLKWNCFHDLVKFCSSTLNFHMFDLYFWLAVILTSNVQVFAIEFVKLDTDLKWFSQFTLKCKSWTVWSGIASGSCLSLMLISLFPLGFNFIKMLLFVYTFWVCMYKLTVSRILIDKVIIFLLPVCNSSTFRYR